MHPLNFKAGEDNAISFDLSFSSFYQEQAKVVNPNSRERGVVSLWTLQAGNSAINISHFRCGVRLTTILSLVAAVPALETANRSLIRGSRPLWLGARVDPLNSSLTSRFQVLEQGIISTFPPGGLLTEPGNRQGILLFEPSYELVNLTTGLFLFWLTYWVDCSTNWAPCLQHQCFSGSCPGSCYKWSQWIQRLAARVLRLIFSWSHRTLQHPRKCGLVQQSQVTGSTQKERGTALMGHVII